MIKFENTEVVGFEAAIRGMRNPKNSWSRSDTAFYSDGDLALGENDSNLMQALAVAGPVHRKFLRMIEVYVDITASHTWWAEFDTYKVGTVRNSCSKMHKIHVKEFVADDFDHEGIDAVDKEYPGFAKILDDTLENLEWLRVKFNETQDKKYWRAIIELLPMGYHIKATVMMSYEVLANIYQPDCRRWHKLDEWCLHEPKLQGREYFTNYGFCDWIRELPVSFLITGEGNEQSRA